MASCVMKANLAKSATSHLPEESDGRQSVVASTNLVALRCDVWQGGDFVGKKVFVMKNLTTTWYTLAGPGVCVVNFTTHNASELHYA